MSESYCATNGRGVRARAQAIAPHSTYSVSTLLCLPLQESKQLVCPTPGPGVLAAGIIAYHPESSRGRHNPATRAGAIGISRVQAGVLGSRCSSCRHPQYLVAVIFLLTIVLSSTWYRIHPGRCTLSCLRMPACAQPGRRVVARASFDVTVHRNPVQPRTRNVHRKQAGGIKRPLRT